jgi:uncharacterized protein (TIGR00369 family)
MSAAAPAAHEPTATEPSATESAETEPSAKALELEARLRAAPFHDWLGLRVVDATATDITLTATWREEWDNGTEARTTHGGVVMTLLDLAADWAIASAVGAPVPTLDFSVHFLRAAKPGNLTVIGRIVKNGRSITVAEAEVLDADGKSVAVGRGTYASFAG